LDFECKVTRKNKKGKTFEFLYLQSESDAYMGIHDIVVYFVSLKLRIVQYSTHAFSSTFQ